MDDFGDFGDPGARDLAGPLVGGGLTQVGLLATKMLAKNSPRAQKWAPTIGFAVGGLVSGILAIRRSTRAIGVTGLLTAALIAIPRQVEELVGGSLSGYLGIITPEQQGMMGYGEDMNGPVEVLSEAAGNGMGVYTADSAMQGPADVEIMGSGAFGSNFMQ